MPAFSLLLSIARVRSSAATTSRALIPPTPSVMPCSRPIRFCFSSPPLPSSPLLSPPALLSSPSPCPPTSSPATSSPLLPPHILADASNGWLLPTLHTIFVKVRRLVTCRRPQLLQASHRRMGCASQ
eukprot:78813-Hanusia_phi.AAC.1